MNSMRRFQHGLWQRPAFFFFLSAFLIYNLNLRPISSGDTAPAALLPFSVLMDGSVNFDRFVPWLTKAYDGAPYFLHPKDGHSYSRYPILQPLLLTPLYTPLLLIRNVKSWPTESLVLLARVLEKIAASLVAALSVACFFCLLRRLSGKRHAVVLTLVFGFATSTWSIASQALWQHGASQLTIILSLLCLEKFFENETDRMAMAGAGLFAALSVAMRPTNVLFFGISFAVLLLFRARWKLLAFYTAFGILIGSALAVYNLTIFGNLRGGYAQALAGRFWAGFSGLLFSPGRGLFVYSPLFLFLFPAVFLWLRKTPASGNQVYAISLAFSVSHILLYAKWPMWWAGCCYGTRFITDAIPCLVILLVPVLAFVEKNKPAKVAFAALFTASLYVQFLGAFNYPHSEWDATPVPVDQHAERLWNWKDNPIGRSIQAGIDLKGYTFLLDVIESQFAGRPLDLKRHGVRVQ
jgi:hypothetical protein